MNTLPTLLKKRPLMLMLAASMTLGLAACGRDEGTTVGQKIDSAVATTESKAESMADKAKESMNEVKTDVAQAADKAAQTMENAGDKVSAAVDDAGVTAKVNAELAKDSSLSALKIDVDTRNGHVSLKGSAPDADAKARATRIAEAVQGVVSVDNQLRVGS